jgi:hypothetical protein
LAPISVLQEIGVAYMSILLARVNSRPALTEEELKARRERRDQQREEAQKRETEAAEKAVVAVRNSLAAVDANFKMPDGRRLGDWTIGEIRKLGGVFTIILAKAGTKDDARTVDVVMTRNDWKRVKL